MSNELDQLRADLATIKAAMEIYDRDYKGTDNFALIGVIEAKIARLEAEQADPWLEAKDAISYWSDNAGYSALWAREAKVIAYVSHLTAENARLAARVAELEAANELPFWPSEGEIQAIKPQDEKAIMDAAVELMNGLGVDSAKAGEDRTVIDSANCNRLIEWFGALEDTRREFLESADYRLAKAIYDSCGRTVPGSVLKGCWLTDVHAAKVDPDDPILDPARVMATAAEWLEGSKDCWLGHMGKNIKKYACGAKNAKPYRLKGGENGS